MKSEMRREAVASRSRLLQNQSGMEADDRIFWQSCMGAPIFAVAVGRPLLKYGTKNYQDIYVFTSMAVAHLAYVSFAAEPLEQRLNSANLITQLVTEGISRLSSLINSKDIVFNRYYIINLRRNPAPPFASANSYAEIAPRSARAVSRPTDPRYRRRQGRVRQPGPPGRPAAPFRRLRA